MHLPSFFDKKIQSTTMYRVVEYALGSLAGYAILLSFFRVLSYNPFFLACSLVVLVGVCYITNAVCSYRAKRPDHSESAVITGFILFFLFPPMTTLSDVFFLAMVAISAMASKYIFAWHGKQICNPAAFSAVVFGLMGYPAIWWVGSLFMLPAVCIAALCVLKKIQRWNLFLITVFVSFIPILLLAAKNNINIFNALIQHIVSWPIIFFASFMVTEPLTMPPTKKFQMMYGALVGVLSSVPFSFGFLYSSPELALCIGNIFSYSVSMNRRILFRLKEKTYIAKDICEFIFQADCACVFSPGQYMEWTLPHEHPDARGIRRYFTLASSPTEKEIRIAVRFTAPLSSFKKKLRLLECGDTMLASQLCGDFVLPKKTDKKIGYIAGGIGITPFRSMMKYCIDTREKRDSILFYVNKTPEDIAYTELLHEVCAYSMRVVYSVDAIGNTVEWNGEIGVFTSKIIEKYISDAQERLWYISGPQGMVGAYKKILLGMGVKRGNIKTDYFPGYA